MQSNQPQTDFQNYYYPAMFPMMNPWQYAQYTQQFLQQQALSMAQQYQFVPPFQAQNFLQPMTPQVTQIQMCLNKNSVLKQEEIANEQEQNDSKVDEKDEDFNYLQKADTVRQVKKTNSQANQNRRGHWTNEEHYKYLKFVRKNKQLFQTSVQKKLSRVFKMMSLEIPTRTACQCRSHYSKFNPFDNSTKIRRKLVNDEEIYEKMFNDQELEEEKE